MVLPKAKARVNVGPQLEKLVRTHGEIAQAKEAYHARRAAAKEEKKWEPPEYNLSEDKQERFGKCFELWCDPGHHDLTRKSAMKLFKDAGICGPDKSQVPSVTVDLLFEKHKQPRNRKITFEEFVYMVLEMSGKVDVEMETLVGHILDQVGEGPDFHNVSVQPGLARSTAEGDLTGPEKFFYDKATFTGSHTKGGPRAIDSTDGYLHGFQALIHREHIQNDSVQRKKAVEAFDPKASTKKPRSLASRGPERFADPSTFTGTHKQGGPKAVDGKALKYRPLPRHEPKPPEVKRMTDPGRGPERFYYDKGTFTGAHRHGGPDATYRTAGGYHDFSKLIHRDHVQDDHHHRRKSGDEDSCGGVQSAPPLVSVDSSQATVDPASGGARGSTRGSQLGSRSGSMSFQPKSRVSS
ncbi:unnamed protein product [Amoebophrya sp. A120]|nr:unnamed protein product [Amoebophrya sp. A120]|eukprot:GSA120T00005492001.1